MTYAPDELLKLIHDSRALSIWNREKGPVFWYIAGVPGPFYVNTEWLIGEKLALNLLAKIDEILANTPADNAASRATQLNELILKAYESEPVYQKIVASMIARAKDEFPMRSFTFVSGGERRDWLFSIPFAKECGLKHIFMFKNKTIYCDQPVQTEEIGLHVSDLINNAVSYTNMWLPVLEKAGLKCTSTVCIIGRGEAGVKALAAKGVKAVSLISIDLAFFERSKASGLIPQDMLDEIALHFTSPKDWAMKYLMGRAELFDVKNANKKSLERMRSFFIFDPWGLCAANETFFKTMQKKIPAGD